MKKIVFVLVAAMVLVFTGCEKKETISMPFDVTDVNNIEMYRNAEPYSAEKQVITESEDIADLYSLFSGLEVSDKKTEPVVGETITSFRFNLSDDRSYEIIYCAEAVKSGRLKFPAEKLDYFTSADIGGRWDSYQYEIVPVSESELPGQSENPSDPPLEETHEWDKIPMVMVDGKLYYDTGKESTISGRCGVMDGEITSTVDGSEIPTKDNQSNFGTGFEYQYGAGNTIEIFMNEKWIVFEQREGDGSQVRYGDRMVDAEGLSKETLEWLDWYNSLPEEQQLAVSCVPPDLIEESGLVKTEESKSNDDTICSYPTAKNSLGVRLRVDNVTPTGLTLICNQSGGEPKGEIQTGTTYFLEKYSDGAWQKLGSFQDFAWEDVAIIVQKGEEIEWEIDWSEAYGSLDMGRYRIGKAFDDYIMSSGDYDSYTIYAEFEIVE